MHIQSPRLQVRVHLAFRLYGQACACVSTGLQLQACARRCECVCEAGRAGVHASRGMCPPVCANFVLNGPAERLYGSLVMGLMHGLLSGPATCSKRGTAFWSVCLC